VVPRARPAAPAPAAAAPAGASAAAASPVQDALGAAWSRVLGVAAAPGDDFFDLGGDSMMSVRLIRELEQRLGRHVPAVVLFEESRLDRMADRIARWIGETGDARG
ncbi:acyl carrier protein, partial [Cellulomonas phragmiteti]